MKRLSGLTLLDEREGDGRVAQIGDRVVYNMRLYLNKGDEVSRNETQAEHVSKEKIRIQDGVTLIDRTVTLGRREVIAGIENALIGMTVNGYRKVRISPHLAYRDRGLPELIPPHAVLVAEIWLRVVLEASTVRAQ
ncbi:MAG: FKBP-type peptidyl-prolyl cis-trans isomerase [Nitrospira sp.]|nr:FKBP-type peptidyl-prolyl cis-trans isomerase [Nitrospira sp.]